MTDNSELNNYELNNYQFDNSESNKWNNVRLALLFNYELKNSIILEELIYDFYNIEKIIERDDIAAYQSYLENFLIPRLDKMNMDEFKHFKKLCTSNYHPSLYEIRIPKFIRNFIL